MNLKKRAWKAAQPIVMILYAYRNVFEETMPICKSCYRSIRGVISKAKGRLSRTMDYRDILDIAAASLYAMEGKSLDLLEIFKPQDLEYAKHLGKTVSKLSPILGNLIEYLIVQELNKRDWKGLGTWIRQDPGFPDALFRSSITPEPGIEIKTWFPLSTEITARFKDSISFFELDQTRVALVAWLPEYIIFGKPKILGVWVCSARSLAEARDSHYFKPPSYLILEPEDTTSRTPNLQQTNTNGYVFQGTSEELSLAEEDLARLGLDSEHYSPDKEYQQKVKEIQSKYSYRLDTNYSKIDRIEHEEIERFKKKILEMEILGHTIKEWSAIVSQEKDALSELIKD